MRRINKGDTWHNINDQVFIRDSVSKTIIGMVCQIRTNNEATDFLWHASLGRGYAVSPHRERQVVIDRLLDAGLDLIVEVKIEFKEDIERDLKIQERELLDQLNHTCKLKDIPLKHYEPFTQEKIRELIYKFDQLKD